MSAATMTIRVEEDLKKEFFEATKRSDRNSSQVIRDLMRTYVARQYSSEPPLYSEDNYLKRTKDGLDEEQAKRCFSRAEHRARLASRRSAVRAFFAD